MSSPHRSPPNRPPNRLKPAIPLPKLTHGRMIPADGNRLLMRQPHQCRHLLHHHLAQQAMRMSFVKAGNGVLVGVGAKLFGYLRQMLRVFLEGLDQGWRWAVEDGGGDGGEHGHPFGGIGAAVGGAEEDLLFGGSGK